MQPNILTIVLDDAGVGDIGCYGAPDAAITPNIDALATAGWRGLQAYSDSVCSPSRCSLLTGEYAFRANIGTAVKPNLPGPSMPEVEALPNRLALAGYHSIVAGKWHLASADDDPPMHPLRCGFEHARIVPGNVTSYTSWTQYNDGAPVNLSGYLTTQQVDDMIELIGETPPPRFCYLPLTAAHSPYHAPPPDLHPYGAIDPHHTRLAFKAALSAADTELGRLLEYLECLGGDWRIIMVGDNGTPKDAQPPGGNPDRAKQTTFQGGIHVPLISTVPLGDPSRLANLVDLFATIHDWAGVDLVPPTDSISLAGSFTRPYIFSSRYAPNGPIAQATDYDRCVFDGTWKLRRVPTGDELYHVIGEDDGADVAAENADQVQRLHNIMNSLGV